jgi:hypothetical protein
MMSLRRIKNIIRRPGLKIRARTVPLRRKKRNLNSPYNKIYNSMILNIMIKIKMGKVSNMKMVLQQKELKLQLRILKFLFKNLKKVN